MNTKELGAWGETRAADVLIDKGFFILERNFRNRYGEIDIIAKKEGVLHFVEVKTRRSQSYGLPVEAVHAKKQYRIRQVASWYIGIYTGVWETLSFDVFEVLKIGNRWKYRYSENVF